MEEMISSDINDSKACFGTPDRQQRISDFYGKITPGSRCYKKLYSDLMRSDDDCKVSISYTTSSTAVQTDLTCRNLELLENVVRNIIDGETLNQVDILSRFHFTPIKVDEVDYISVHEAYESFKADFLNLKNRTIAKIAEKHPAVVNDLLINFSSPEWSRSIAECVMLSLNYEKFLQNSSVRQYLASINGQEILEMNFGSYPSFGENFDEKEIWRKIFSKDLPDFLLLADDSMENIRLEKNFSCKICLVRPGSSFIHVGKLAKLLANLPKIGLIIHVGIYDLSTENGQYKHRGGINPNMLARRSIHLAHDIARKFDITVVLSVTLPRRGSCQLERKNLSFGEKLVVQKTKASLRQDATKVVIFDARSEFHHPGCFEDDGFRLSRTGVEKFESALNHALHCIKTGKKNRFLL